MSCIDRRVRLGFAGLSLIAGCSSPVPPPLPPLPPKSPIAPNTGPATPRARAPVPTTSSLHLPPPGPVRSWNEVRLQAAHRLVAANPGGTYTGHVQEPLLAIPVLEIELNGDGSIRRINVLRHPSQANDTTQLAVDAVRRSAPFGDVSRLPKPWRFTETFLFDDDRKFKPRTLDP